MLAPVQLCLLDVPLRFDETKEQQGREREKEVRKERLDGKKGDVMQRSHAGAWAMELSLATGVAGEGGDSDLSHC